MPVLLIAHHGREVQRRPYARPDSLRRSVDRLRRRLEADGWHVTCLPDDGLQAHGPNGESLYAIPEDATRVLQGWLIEPRGR